MEFTMNERVVKLASSRDPKALGVVGFSLLTSPVLSPDGLTFVVQFSNRTVDKIKIEWNDSHLFRVIVTDKDGTTVDVNSLMPPPIPQDPTIVNAGEDFTMVFPVDTTQPPYSGNLIFDARKSPYRIDVAANAKSHRCTASVTLDVVRSPA